jgi:M6 family metalloprotease-like protein
MALTRGIRGVRTRLIIRILSFSLVISLAPISFIQQVSAAPISVNQCKLSDQFNYSVRLGFPKDSARLSSTGTQKVLLLAIDYSDAPTTENATEALKLAFDTDHINEFYKSVSYGQLSFTFDIHPTVIRMPKTSSNYVGTLGNTYPQPIYVSNIMQDAARVVSGQVNFSSYQMVAILDLARIDKWGYWGFAIPDSAPGFATTTGYIKNSTVIGAWEGNSKTALAKGYKTSVLKHEIGHLFGFVDLYIIAPGNYFIGQTPGPFDVMNATSGPAHEFLAWQRWLQGWITDSNVTCFAFSDPTSTVQLRPLGKSSSGTQMAVIRVSAQKALVLESRKGTATDNLSGNDGLLAYEIDLSVPSLQGPIKIIPKNSAATLSPLNPDFSDIERYLDGTAQTGEYIRYKDILIENKLGNQDGESIQIYKGDAASNRQRELDNIGRAASIAELNRVRAAKANNTYYESPTCIQRGQKLTFQTLDEKRIWKDLEVPIKFTTDATCYSALFSKPYIITQLPSRTFYRGKVTSPGTNMEWFTGIAITDAVPLNDKTQTDLEIALAKLEDNYYVDAAGCHSPGITGTMQIERDGAFVDFVGVTSWIPTKNCANPNLVQPYVIARLASGTKYRFKLQASGWDRDFFTQVYTKAKTIPELLAEVNQKYAELNALTLTLAKQKTLLELEANSLNQQIVNAKAEIERINAAKTTQNEVLTAFINNLRSEKAELEGTVATLRTQLVTSNAEIEKLQESLAQEKSNFVSVTGELITAKTKLEGDVAILQKENSTLKTKVETLTKMTITCIKGTTQKKVTGVKPVCPSGFKKKT